jgi:REP element-mobilizing transposase RayT
MARKPRIDQPGAWHHVMHRGARRAPIFASDDHCGTFLGHVADTVETFEIEVHAYSLMPNHYHLLVRSRHGNLSRAMRHLNASYTQHINALHDWDGPIFRGRFRSELVRNEAVLPFVLAYIHLNPLRAGLVTRLGSDCWTSHRAYVGRDPAPDWLSRDHFLGWIGSAARLNDFVGDVHRKRIAWPDEMSLDTGWLNDSGAIAAESKGHVEPTAATRFLPPRKVIATVCATTGATRIDLKRAASGPRANPPRRFCVFALRRWTSMTHGEIGAALDMSETQVANVLRRFDAEAEPMKRWGEVLLMQLCDK